MEQTDGSRDKDIRVVDSLGHPGVGRGIRHQVRGKGVAMYHLIWSMDHGVAFGRWLTQKNAEKMVAPRRGGMAAG